MPCMDNGVSSGYGSDGDGKTVKLLCRVMKHLKQFPAVRAELLRKHPKLRAWTLEHDRMDQQRVQQKCQGLKRKRDKASAMAKLTRAERRALGLER